MDGKRAGQGQAWSDAVTAGLVGDTDVDRAAAGSGWHQAAMREHGGHPGGSEGICGIEADLVGRVGLDPWRWGCAHQTGPGTALTGVKIRCHPDWERVAEDMVSVGSNGKETEVGSGGLDGVGLVGLGAGDRRGWEGTADERIADIHQSGADGDDQLYRLPVIVVEGRGRSQADPSPFDRSPPGWVHSNHHTLANRPPRDQRLVVVDSDHFGQDKNHYRSIREREAAVVAAEIAVGGDKGHCPVPLGPNRPPFDPRLESARPTFALAG